MVFKVKSGGGYIWLLVVAASAAAVIFLNSLSFGLSFARIFDSLTFTLCVAGTNAAFILPLSRLIDERPFGQRILAIILVIIPATYLGAWLGAIFQMVANPFFDDYSGIPSFRTLVFSLVISYIFGLGGYLYISSRDRLNAAQVLIKKKAEEEEKARSLAAEARLASLESRIHPHFLFNTLNSIAALIKEDPVRAERMVESLSRVLRKSLDTSDDGLVTLEQEVELVKDYLEIQKTRFEDRLKYEFEIDQSLSDSMIPTFSIHTLVDNSLKHSGNDNGTSINISAFETTTGLTIWVEDDGTGFSIDDLKNGHGLDNLKERMAGIYGEPAKLEISGTRVTLVFPR